MIAAVQPLVDICAKLDSDQVIFSHSAKAGLESNETTDSVRMSLEETIQPREEATLPQEQINQATNHHFCPDKWNISEQFTGVNRPNYQASETISTSLYLHNKIITV